MLNFAALVEAEQQTRELVEGYDYLKELSSAVPASYQEMASFYREQMSAAASIISPLLPEDTRENSPEQNLNMLRMELQSISHERVIVDVLTRQTMSKNKLASASASVSASAGGSSYAAPASSSRSRAEYRVASQSLPAAALSEHIPLPEYCPGGPSAQPKPKPKQRGGDKQSPYPSGSVAPTVRRLPVGAVMVPSLRQGSLPPELQALRSEPAAAPPTLERRAGSAGAGGSSRGGVRKPRTQAALQGFAQAVRSFRSQLAGSQGDLEALRAHVEGNLR